MLHVLGGQKVEFQGNSRSFGKSGNFLANLGNPVTGEYATKTCTFELDIALFFYHSFYDIGKLVARDNFY